MPSIMLGKMFPPLDPLGRSWLLLLAVGWLLAQPAAAQTDSQHRLDGQRIVLALITDMARYQSGQGDHALHTHIQDHLTRLQVPLKALLASPNLTAEATHALKRQWATTARALSANLVTVQQGGFLDQEVRYQYQARMTAFWQQLAQLPLPPLPEAEAALAQPRLTLPYASLRYQFPHWSLTPYEGQSLPELVAVLEAQLTPLASLPAVGETLQAKWPLLRKALLNEERSMGFLVNRYSRDVIEVLDQRLASTRF